MGTMRMGKNASAVLSAPLLHWVDYRAARSTTDSATPRCSHLNSGYPRRPVGRPSEFAQRQNMIGRVKS